MKVNELYIRFFLYLENIYFQTKINDLGLLLGDMRILEDNISADPAIYEDWINIYNSIYKIENDIFKICITFLNDYSNRLHSKELPIIINRLEENELCKILLIKEK